MAAVASGSGVGALTTAVGAGMGVGGGAGGSIATADAVGGIVGGGVSGGGSVAGSGAGASAKPAKAALTQAMRVLPSYARHRSTETSCCLVPAYPMLRRQPRTFARVTSGDAVHVRKARVARDGAIRVGGSVAAPSDVPPSARVPGGK
jgi:hypothetical protein